MPYSIAHYFLVTNALQWSIIHLRCFLLGRMLFRFVGWVQDGHPEDITRLGVTLLVFPQIVLSEIFWVACSKWI